MTGATERTCTTFRRLMGALTAATVAACLLSPARVLAWGATGHSVVAELAERRLDPATRARLALLLGRHVSLASLSQWADTEAIIDARTRSWHFINIPVGAKGIDLETQCRTATGPSCIVIALERQASLLGSRQADKASRIAALKYVVHLVADIHQPMHCAERDGDGGGNTLAVEFSGQQITLHQLWDYALLDKASYDWGWHVEETSRWLAAHGSELSLKGSFADWASETHGVAVATAYGLLSGTTVTAQYQAAATPVAHAQLGKAALRLAAVLQRALRRTGR